MNIVNLDVDLNSSASKDIQFGLLPVAAEAMVLAIFPAAGPSFSAICLAAALSVEFTTFGGTVGVVDDGDMGGVFVASGTWKKYN